MKRDKRNTAWDVGEVQDFLTRTGILAFRILQSLAHKTIVKPVVELALA